MKKTIAIAISLIIVITTMFSAGMITTSAATLKTPVVTKTEVVANGIKLTWSRVPGAAKYRVFVKRGTSWKSLGDTASTSWTDKTAKVGKSYTYTVRCVTKNGRKFTSSFNRKGFTVSRLATPKITKTEGSETGTKITWNKVAGAYQYRVFVKTNKGWKVLGNTRSTSWTDKTAVAGKASTYTVRCISKNKKAFTSYFNSTGFSAIHTATPVITQSFPTSAGLNITWNKVAGAGQYRVFLKSESGWVKLADTKNNQYTYSDAQNGQSYTFTVRALSANGKYFISSFVKDGYTVTYNISADNTEPTAPTDGKDPDELPFVPSDPTEPTTPTSPASPTTPTVNYIPTITGKEISNNKIKLSWNKLSGIYSYAVFYKNGDNWQLLNNEVVSPTYSYPFDEAGNYTFSVIGLDPADDQVHISPDNASFTASVKYVVDQEAYSYEKPITKQEAYCCCNKCGADVTGDEKGNASAHGAEYAELSERFYHYQFEGCSTAWHTAYRTVITGYETVNVPETGHFEIA